MTHDDQIKFKPVQCLFKHEIVFPSLKDDCHPGPAHFGNDQFPFGNHNQGEKKVIKSLDSFFLMLYSQSKFHLKTNHELR